MHRRLTFSSGACLIAALLFSSCDDPFRAADTPRPAIDLLVPDFGDTAGNDWITVRGTGFAGEPGVLFNGVPARAVERLSDSELRVLTPPGSEGPVDVQVANDTDHRATLENGFTYQDPLLAPTLTAIAPDCGFAGGGTSIAVTGANLQAGAQVFFGGVAATSVIVHDATSATVTTPATAEGQLDVVWENPDGRRATLLDAFCAAFLDPDEYEVLNLVNQERAANGLDPLVLHPSLILAARGHSQDMADRDFFSHTNPDGEGPADRAAQEGYPSSYVGENIAAGYSTPAAVMQAWMNSPGHRANILNANYQEIGIGRATGGSYGIYWTQVFGRP